MGGHLLEVQVHCIRCDWRRGAKENPARLASHRAKQNQTLPSDPAVVSRSYDNVPIRDSEMSCGHCDSENVGKNGKDRNGNQQVRCRDCGKTTTVRKPQPLGSMRIEEKDAVFALKLLLEGMSIRATERLTGLHRDTLCSLIVTVGTNCKELMRSVMDDVPVADVQVDEIWGFVGAKEKNARRLHHAPSQGDAYCYFGIERSTKLVVCYLLGKRDAAHADVFIDQLASITNGKFQLSTDGFTPYRNTVRAHLGGRVDHGLIIKQFGNDPNGEGQRRYSPAAIISIKKEANVGTPKEEQICTSHVERANLTLRMQLRRMTRLTNAFSKKFANHDAMLGLFFAWYNFVRPHSSLKKTTPAAMHGVAKEPWSMEKLLKEAAYAAAA